MLLGLGGVDLLHPLAEIIDVLTKRIQQRVDGFAAALLEPARLLAQNIVSQIAELRPQGLLVLHPVGLLAVVAGDLLAQLLLGPIELRQQGGPFAHQLADLPLGLLGAVSPLGTCGLRPRRIGLQRRQLRSLPDLHPVGPQIEQEQCENRQYKQ